MDLTLKEITDTIDVSNALLLINMDSVVQPEEDFQYKIAFASCYTHKSEKPVYVLPNGSKKGVRDSYASGLVNYWNVLATKYNRKLNELLKIISEGTGTPLHKLRLAVGGVSSETSVDEIVNGLCISVVGPLSAVPRKAFTYERAAAGIIVPQLYLRLDS